MSFDIVIIGAGPAGLCFARSLAGSGLRIALVERHAWDGLLVATAVVAAALVVSLVIGVAQARRMSRLRAAALCAEEGGAVVSRVRHGARAAALLRATIGALSLVLIALGALLAT